MFRRKAYEQLVEWRRVSQGSTAMLIKGARRVGKSTVAEEFAKAEYSSYALIDFTKVTDEFKQTFLDMRNDLDGLFLYIQAMFGVALVQRESLIVFDAIPGQLAKHEKKLAYTQIEDGSRSRDFMMAFSWLKEAATVNPCTLSNDPSLGLALGEDVTRVKCYMADTGLLATEAFSSGSRVLSDVYRQVLLGEEGVNEGMLAENAVAQQLVANGYDLYFYSKSSAEKDERMEIDFLIARPYANAAMKPRLSPIEVKAGKRYTTISLDKFKRKFGKRVGAEYVIHPREYQVEGDRYFIPLYMSFCL